MITIGTDIIQISRMQTLISEKGNKFLNKVFTSNEINYCNNNNDPSIHFSGKFAAKESVKKALLSNKLTDFISLKDIEILNRDDKAPHVVLNHVLNTKVECDISISHDGDYALSFVMVKKI